MSAFGELVGEMIQPLLELCTHGLVERAQRRRGESVDGQWRRVGPWLGVPFGLFSALCLVLCFVAPSQSAHPVWTIAMLMVVGGLCAWVPGRWLLAVVRRERVEL
jgi:hypothetical protein